MAWTSAAVESVIARVDFLAERGAGLMKRAAVFAWLGAAATTVAALSPLGALGWIAGLICTIPGWMLWRYGRSLAGAFDVAKIRGQVSSLAGSAKARLTDAVDGLRTTRKQPILGGFRVLRSVWGLKADLGNLGVDVTGIAEVANPGAILLAALSLAAGLVLWAVALLAIIIRTLV